MAIFFFINIFLSFPCKRESHYFNTASLKTNNKTYVLLVKLKYHIYCKTKNSSVFIYLHTENSIDEYYKIPYQ